MSTAEAVFQMVKTLPEADQKRVLEFVAQISRSPPAPGSTRGLFAHRGFDVTFEDIQAARREGWGSFPRELPEESGARA